MSLFLEPLPPFTVASFTVVGIFWGYISYVMLRSESAMKQSVYHIHPGNISIKEVLHKVRKRRKIGMYIMNAYNIFLYSILIIIPYIFGSLGDTFLYTSGQSNWFIWVFVIMCYTYFQFYTVFFFLRDNEKVWITYINKRTKEENIPPHPDTILWKEPFIGLIFLIVSYVLFYYQMHLLLVVLISVLLWVVYIMRYIKPEEKAYQEYLSKIK